MDDHLRKQIIVGDGFPLSNETVQSILDEVMQESMVMNFTENGIEYEDISIEQLLARALWKISLRVEQVILCN